MKTHYASAERETADTLKKDVELVSKNPVINGLLNVVSGLFAVLNRHRQVITVNTAIMDMLGIKDPEEIIGLRPGETLNCIHAHEGEGGCGTSEFCPTCGAAIAIVLSLEKKLPVEKFCAIEVNKNERIENLYLRVRSFPIQFKDNLLILLFLQDMTHQQRLLTLERVFFHDISNMISGLISTSNLLAKGVPEKQEKALERMSIISQRLAHEITIQRALVHNDLHTYQPNLHNFSLEALFRELGSLFYSHPLSEGKKLTFEYPESSLGLYTDFSMLVRVISNMVANALEASQEGDEVKVYSIVNGGSTQIKVWNHQPISKSIALRIFQRNFSTKNAEGRGLGTYSMKLLGEEFLGGRVDFTSSASEGTVFSIALDQNR